MHLNGPPDRIRAVGCPDEKAVASVLTRSQRKHFADHGWVVLPGMVSHDLCERLSREMDSVLAGLNCWDPANGVQGFSEPHLRAPLFLELFKVPGLLTACKELIGHRQIRMRHCVALITHQHPRAHSDIELLTNPDHWDWHRDFAPDSIIRPHPSTDYLLTSQVVVAAVFLNNSDYTSGVTAFLDRTHLVAGDYNSLKERYTPAQPTIACGSVLFFTEALLHAAPPVIGSRCRRAVLTWMTAPWFSGENVAPFDVHRWKDDELKEIFCEAIFGDAPI